MAQSVVGADVPAARVPVGVPDVVPWASRGRGAPRTSRPTRCAHGVRVRRAVCVCGHGAVRGRGRRPRRPACPWASSMSFRGQRRAEDVAPDQVRAWRACADVACVGGHGAVHGRGRRPRRPARPWASPMAFSWATARRGRRAGPGARMACVCGRGVRVRRAMCVCGCGAVRGRGRRPRRPARPWRSRCRSVGAARRGRRALPGARMACVCGARCACADVARSVVGADVPGGPRPRGRPRCRPVDAARRGRRALPGARMACVCGARCACADMVRCVVGADVPGGPRPRGRPRCRPVGAARRGRRAGPGARMACVCGHGVRVRRAVCVCGRGAERGRGRRPGGPRTRGRSRCRPVGAARRGRRAQPGARIACVCGRGVRVRRAMCVCGRGAVRGRGRRPRRPARPWRSRCRSVGAARRGRRALPGGVVWNVVGADVPGGPRPRGSPDGVPWARRAEDVAPDQVRAWRAKYPRRPRRGASD